MYPAGEAAAGAGPGGGRTGSNSGSTSNASLDEHVAAMSLVQLGSPGNSPLGSPKEETFLGAGSGRSGARSPVRRGRTSSRSRSQSPKGSRAGKTQAKKEMADLRLREDHLRNILSSLVERGCASPSAIVTDHLKPKHGGRGHTWRYEICTEPRPDYAGDQFLFGISSVELCSGNLVPPSQPQVERAVGPTGVNNKFRSWCVYDPTAILFECVVGSSIVRLPPMLGFRVHVTVLYSYRAPGGVPQSDRVEFVALTNLTQKGRFRFDINFPTPRPPPAVFSQPGPHTYHDHKLVVMFQWITVYQPDNASERALQGEPQMMLDASFPLDFHMAENTPSATATQYPSSCTIAGHIKAHQDPRMAQ